MNAQEEIEGAVKTLAAKYPTAGLTFGYIGNLWGADMGFLDDRSWRVFSKMTTEGIWGPKRASWGYHGTAALHLMASQIREGKLEQWIIKHLKA